MEEIDALIDVLGRVHSPFLEARRPGLTPDELREAASLHLPWFNDYIDDQVVDWYAWQNGADPNALAAGGESWQGCAVITPDGLALTGIEDIVNLEIWEIVGADVIAEELGFAFPLGKVDGAAGDLYLRKASPHDEWTVCAYWLESGVENLRTAAGYNSPPTFRQWLAALTEAINSGRLVLGPYGNITVANGGPKRTDLHHYPWNS